MIRVLIAAGVALIMSIAIGPRFIEFRSDLPKSNVGKILRRALREEALAGRQ